jgi:hypothetical protein
MPRSPIAIRDYPVVIKDMMPYNSVRLCSVIGIIEMFRILPSFLMIVFGLPILVDSAACSRREPAGSSTPGHWRQWSGIQFVRNYVWRGDVDEDEDLSGIACISKRRCLVGADEGRKVQVLELSRSAKTLEVVADVPLVATGEEIDIEAITAQGHYCYITGSHGLSKKEGEMQPNRFKIFRLKVDPGTGMPNKQVGTGTQIPANLHVASLSNVLRNDPVLRDYFLKPLQHKGVNIEGLAAKENKLYIGFRSPNLRGCAYVLEIAAEDAFATSLQTDYRLHELAVGHGYGIREVVAARSCFLIIAGNSGSEPSEKYPEAQNYEEERGFVMFSWDGRGSDVHRIGRIPRAAGKAEAMTVLNESSEQIEVLVLFDGPEGGAPSVHRIY